MGMPIFRHWRLGTGIAVGFSPGWIPVLWRWFVWALDWGGRVEILEDVARFMPPIPGKVVWGASLIAGLLLIWWDSRRSSARQSVAPLSGLLPLWNRPVPFHEAARLFYEEMERSGIDDRASAGYSVSDPAAPLDHCKYVILSAAERGSLALSGARVPSRQSRRIPPDEISQLMPDRNDPNGLQSRSRSSPCDFRDVWLSNRDLRRAIKDRIELIKRVDKGLA